MAKPLYYVSPTTGHLLKYDSLAWSTVIATAPPNFVSIGASSAASSPNNSFAPFVWRGRLWVMYTHFVASPVSGHINAIEVLTPESTPSWDTANMISLNMSAIGGVSAIKSFMSNIEYYRGMVVRLRFPENTSNVEALVFDDFDTPGTPTFRCNVLSGMPTWNAWESTSSEDGDAHGGGHLFVHDQALYWSPRGGFNKFRYFERLYALDITPTSAACLGNVPNALSSGEASYPQWISDSGTPAALNSSASAGMTHCSLGAGSINGKLYTVNVNGTVDIIDDLTYTRTTVFDLRDSALNVIASSVSPLAPTSAAPSHVRFSRGDAVDPTCTTDAMCITGARLDIVGGPRIGEKYDIVGLYRDGVTPAASHPVELKLLGTITGTTAVPLGPSDLCDIRRGFCGRAFVSGSSGTESALAPLRGSPANCLCLTSGGYTYIITGNRVNAGTSQGILPFKVTRWDGTIPATVDEVEIGSSLNLSGVDAVIDTDANLMHIMFYNYNASNGEVRHATVNLTTFLVEVNEQVVNVNNSSTNSRVVCGVQPGNLFAFTTYEPTAEITGTPTFNVASVTTTINFKLWTQKPGGMDTVSVAVEYNIGDGWMPATAYTETNPLTDLTANSTGEDTTFIHDFGEDEPSYVGPVLYRLTTSVDDEELVV